MKYILLICLSVLLFSCGENEVNNEVVSMEELIGSTTEDTTLEQVSTMDTTIIADSSLLGKLIRSVDAYFDTSSNASTTIFDRFTTVSKDKVSFITKDSLAENIDLFVYCFDDSTTLNNALFNWLDCFGKNCQEVIPNEDLIGVNADPLWCNIYEDKLTILNSKSSNEESYTELLNAANTLFDAPFKYQFKVDHKQNLTWE